MEKEKKCVTLSLRRDEDCLYLKNSTGQEWEIPSNITSRAAIAMLVFETLYNKHERLSCFFSKYKISMEIVLLKEE